MVFINFRLFSRRRVPLRTRKALYEKIEPGLKCYVFTYVCVTAIPDRALVHPIECIIYVLLACNHVYITSMVLTYSHANNVCTHTHVLMLIGLYVIIQFLR